VPSSRSGAVPARRPRTFFHAAPDAARPALAAPARWVPWGCERRQSPERRHRLGRLEHLEECGEGEGAPNEPVVRRAKAEQSADRRGSRGRSRRRGAPARSPERRVGRRRSCGGATAAPHGRRAHPSRPERPLRKAGAASLSAPPAFPVRRRRKRPACKAWLDAEEVTHPAQARAPGLLGWTRATDRSSDLRAGCGPLRARR
jgi:hypothetical protein